MKQLSGFSILKCKMEWTELHLLMTRLTRAELLYRTTIRNDLYRWMLNSKTHVDAIENLSQ